MNKEKIHTEDVLNILMGLKKNLEQLSTPQEKDFISAKEAAEFLDLRLPTIYSKVCRKELPYMKRGKRLYFSKKQLIEFYQDGSFQPFSCSNNSIDDDLVSIKGRKRK